MSDDIASLGIKVVSGDVATASRQLDGLTNSAKRAETSTGGLTAGFAALAAKIGLVALATAGLNKLLDTAKTFQSLEASLETVTGSAEGAAVAMEAIIDFASKTPYDVGQATEAFIKLTALGLDPSERALRSYGNTSSALGKTLTQMIEAVADASTGEFERLKEFGIKANKQGDEVAFRFRGVTTTVANNAQEIQEYLLKIGETDFAGAMEKRSKTIEGALSNLGDSWDQLFNTISKAGVGDLLAEGVGLANEAISELTAEIKSGQLQAYFSVVGIEFEGIANDISYSFNVMYTSLSESFGNSAKDAQLAGEDIARAFRDVPITIRAAVQESTVDITSFFETLKAKREEFDRTGKSQTADREIPADASPELRARLEGINKARQDSIDAINKEKEDAIKAADEMIEKARQLRQQYDEEQEARRKNTQDRLSQFKVGGDTTATSSLKSQQEFKSVVENLYNEEQAIRASYERRKEIIIKNTAESSEKRASLIKTNEERLNQDLADLRTSELDGIMSGLLTEEQQIEESYNRRIELIRKATRLSEQEKTDLMEAAEIDRQERQKEYDDQRLAQQESGYGNLFSTQQNFLKLMEQGQKASGASQVAIYTNALSMITSAGAQQNRTLFEINKAAGIGNAIVSTYIAATKALELGPILGPIAAGVITAAGLANVAVIAGTQFGGGASAASPSSAGSLAGTGITGTSQTAGLVTPATTAQNTASGPVINIYGPISANNAETLFAELKDLINDGDNVLIEDNSRNGRQLRSL